MTKNELINSVAAKGELTTQQATAAINAVFAAIEEGLCAGERISIAGFGTFEVKERAEKNGRNPRTGEAMTIPQAKIPSFKASKALRDAVDR